MTYFSHVRSIALRRKALASSALAALFFGATLGLATTASASPLAQEKVVNQEQASPSPSPSSETPTTSAPAKESTSPAAENKASEQVEIPEQAPVQAQVQAPVPVPVQAPVEASKAVETTAQATEMVTPVASETPWPTYVPSATSSRSVTAVPAEATLDVGKNAEMSLSNETAHGPGLMIVALIVLGVVSIVGAGMAVYAFKYLRTRNSGGPSGGGQHKG